VSSDKKVRRKEADDKKTKRQPEDILDLLVINVARRVTDVLRRK